MNQAALVFDCDGTLMDSLDHAMESFHYALLKMGADQYPSQEILKYFGVAADRILVQILGDEKRGLEAYEHYQARQRELAPQTLVFPGIRELLMEARSHGVRMGIVTGRHAIDLEILLRPHGLLHFFSCLVTDDR
jgi:phosphoglycolate phosphatase-like HAD superfamily hydrolase